MRSSLLLFTLLLVPQLSYSSGVRDLLNADTHNKEAIYSYGNKMDFLVVGGPRDGVVTLRAFRGTRDQLIAQAHAWRPKCARLQHFVFGGWWVSSRILTFNSRFDDWSLPEGTANGQWLFVFDVQPASQSVSIAGFQGIQELQLDQDTVDAYFKTGLEVTVTNTKPTERTSKSNRTTPRTTPSEPATINMQILPGGSNATHGTNVIPAPVITSLSCSVKQNVLRETTLVVSAGSHKQLPEVIAKRDAPLPVNASHARSRFAWFSWRRTRGDRPSVSATGDESALMTSSTGNSP